MELMKMMTLPPPCPNTAGTQHALIALSSVNANHAVFVFCSCGVSSFCEQGGTDAHDELPLHHLAPGFTVWEGHIHYSKGRHTIDGYCEPELEFVGTFRPPTEEEWRVIESGTNPWECPICHGVGFIVEKEKP